MSPCVGELIFGLGSWEGKARPPGAPGAGELSLGVFYTLGGEDFY